MLSGKNNIAYSFTGTLLDLEIASMSVSNQSFKLLHKIVGQKNNYGLRRNHSIMFYDLTTTVNQLLRMRAQFGGHYISKHETSTWISQADVQTCTSPKQPSQYR